MDEYFKKTSMFWLQIRTQSEFLQIMNFVFAVYISDIKDGRTTVLFKHELKKKLLWSQNSSIDHLTYKLYVVVVE